MKKLSITIICFILHCYFLKCNSLNQSHAWLKCIEDICIPSDYNHLVRPLLNRTNNIQVDLRDIKILKVNDMDMKGVTREEAVLLLLSLQDEINLTAQYCKTEYELVIQHQKGDSFFIK